MMLKLWKVKPWRAIPVAAVAVLAGVVAIPATASAATLFVSTAAPSAPYNSCSHAGYRSIQTALTAAAPDSTINVCAGTYKEQLEITKEVALVGKSNPTVEAPATLKTASTTCETGEEDLVAICMPKTADITGMTFGINEAPTCNDNLNDVVVGGGATLNATKVKVGGATEHSGCQGGLGLLIGHHGQVGVGYASLSKVTVEGYNKNGITVDGPGSEATIEKTTITGAGPVEQGQNGIQVSRGAVATISNVTVSDDECTVPQPVCGHSSQQNWEEDAAGVLFYEPGASSTVVSSKLSNNDIGVEYVSGEPPAQSEVTLAKDKITGGYTSVQLNQGKASLEQDKLTGALIGIDVNSYWEEDNSYAPTATASGDKIEGSEAAIKVESALAPLAGSLGITGSQVRGSIVNDDPRFTIG